MKKLSILSIAFILTLALSACGNDTNSNQLMGGGTDLQNSNFQTTAITRERALEIALEKAGVAQTDIRDLEIELDYERGAKVWEVDFDHGNLEYSYDVDAETGAVTKVQRERDS